MCNHFRWFSPTNSSFHLPPRYGKLDRAPASYGNSASVYHSVRCKDPAASFDAFDGKRLIFLLRDYLDGVAPPVPSLDLEIETGQGVRVTGILNRFDARTEIESWVFPMSGESIGQLYEFAGVRLFARNVRGYLGNSDINHGMDTTIEKEPQFFWYYNNGITIICDHAEQINSRGRGIRHSLPAIQSCRSTRPAHPAP